MKIVALAVLALVAACTDPPTTGGPPRGRWTTDTLLGWGCANACVPPPPFDVAPTGAVVTDDSIQWNGLHAHDATPDGDCIDVAAGNDGGHARDAYSLCTTRDPAGVLQPDMAATSPPIRWDAGLADECSCGAFLRYVGP